MDLALLRKALIEGARKAHRPATETALCSWEYQGPGVWVNVSETILLGETAVFDSAVEWLNDFGEAIPINYLNENIAIFGIKWTTKQKSAKVKERIHELKEFLTIVA